MIALPRREAWHAADTPERGKQARLFESQLADGWKEASGIAGLGRLVSKGWLCTSSEPDTFRYFRGFKM